MAKKPKKIQKRVDISKHPSASRVYKKPDKFGNSSQNIYDNKKPKPLGPQSLGKGKRKDDTLITYRTHPHIGKLSHNENMIEIASKKGFNPIKQPPRLADRESMPYVITPSTRDNETLENLNSNYDNSIYMEALQRSGLRYQVDSDGNLSQMRTEFNCISFNNCGSGGVPWVQNTSTYGFDSSGNAYDSMPEPDTGPWTDSDIGDCSYWPDIWGPHASSAICGEMCSVFCGGVHPIPGDDGQFYGPEYSTGHSVQTPPNDGYGYYSHCGGVSVHPEDCSTYTVKRAHWHTAHCVWRTAIDTACRCRCRHQRAYLIQNELDADGDGYGDVPQIQACLRTDTCNPYGNALLGLPAGTYSWCADPQYSQYCTHQENLCDYS